MLNPVKISVVIPVYNVADYLPFAMQSCIEQTLYDVEFICVNDGSTDNSLEILKTYAQKDPRIIVIDKKNEGVSSARNAGIAAACGKWIMFLDPDDYLDRRACERVWTESEEEATDIIVFGADIVPKLPAPAPWYFYTLTTPARRYYEFSPRVLFGEPSAKPFIWHQAFSRELLLKSGVVFDESLKLGEDQAFLISVYPHASKFAFVQDKLYNYRHIRNNSAMQILRQNSVEKLNQHIAVVSSVFGNWNEKGFSAKYGSELLEWAVDFIVNDLKKDDISDKARFAIASDFKRVSAAYDMNRYASRISRKGRSYCKLIEKWSSGGLK